MAAAVEDRNARFRQILRPFRAKADGFALGLFAGDCAMYGLCVAVAASRAPMLVRLLAGTCEGVLLAVLFVIGHDACHGSFTSRRWLNLSVGRIAFLPTLTPFSTWELSHNLTHHVYTNLKQLDYVWTPLSKGEYDALPGWRRRLERVYRHPLGLALYYPVEIWWRRLLFTSGKRIYFVDSVVCVGVFLVALG